MKLSEAIKLGIGAVENYRSTWLMPKEGGGVCGCAIGTALYAVGEHNNGYVMQGRLDCERVWPWTKNRYLDGISIAQVISTRHYHGESRESLANWIAELEKTYDPSIEAPQPISEPMDPVLPTDTEPALPDVEVPVME